MSGMILRWGVPALLTVVGGTILALSVTGGAMTEALAARAADVLSSDAGGWVSVSFDSRDAVLTGTAPDQAAVAELAAKIAAVHGVRSVRSEVAVAEPASPFPFVATVADGGVSLSGGVPDESLRDEIAGLAGANGDRLRHLSGAPRRDLWQPAVTYGLGLLDYMDEGEVAFDDLNLSIGGRAKSSEAFDQLTRLTAEAPDGVNVTDVTIAPPLASPYTWRATFDGARVAVSGFAPTEAFLEDLQSDSAAGHPVSTSLRLASGAPQNFEANALTLLENLVLLEDGTAEIFDSTLTLSGSPPDLATAERVRSAMTTIGAGFDLAPPRIAAYRFVAERAGEEIALTGHVPDAALLDRLSETSGVDASALELGRGAPDRFESAIDFGLDLLSHMSEGRFTVENTSLSIDGRAATIAEFDDLETTLSLGAPQGLILAFAAVRPPLAEPFTWSAVKAGTEGVTLSGYVPSRAARTRLQTAAIKVESDTTIIADGAPADFESEAGAALKLLQLLETGEITYDGDDWALAGAVTTSEAALAADQAFAASGLREAGWSFDLEAPTPEPVIPVADPYVWTATKGSTGTVSLAGYVPSPETRQLLAANAGAGAIDELNLATGGPDGFAEAAAAGLDALVQLAEGTVAFDGAEWSLTGTVDTIEQRLTVEEELSAALDTSDWRIAIQALDAPPLVAPYAWAASKAADGRITLTGYVATQELKRFVAVRAGEGTIDSTELASGEPAGFIADVLAGLEALAHLSEGSVRLDGGAWSLSGTPRTAQDAELAVAALGTTDEGRWTRQLSDPVVPSEPGDEETAAPDSDMSAEDEPTAAPVVRNYAFSATKQLGGGIELKGTVPTIAARDYLGVIAGTPPGNDLVVGEGLPAGFTPNAQAGIRALAQMASGEFGLDGTDWVLSGRTETEAARAAALEQLAALPEAEDWTTSVELLTPIDRCSERVAVFAGRNAILFQSGSARLAGESNAAIDELVGYLQICPDSIVHIEGHTDADGADDLNLALSVARAEAVVDALIERGVAFQRLYAVGYGESLPVADNDTAAGKRANRRIAFTILDEHR